MRREGKAGCLVSFYFPESVVEMEFVVSDGVALDKARVAARKLASELSCGSTQQQQQQR